MTEQIVLAFRRTFHSLRVRNFRIYLLALAVSTTGIWIHVVASAWLVLRLSDSGVALGVLLALQFGPILVLGALGGVVADRFDKRRTLMVTQATFAVLSTTLGLLAATGAARLWMVDAIALLAGVTAAVDHPTRASFIPEMVGRRLVTNAISLNSAVFTGTRIVGPAIGAAVIAAIGVAPAFLLDGATYVALVAGLALIRSDELHTPERSDGRNGGLREGIRYVWRRRELRGPLALMAVVFTASFNFWVLVPLLAERAFGGDAGTYGALMSVTGAGMFAGALVFAHRSRPGHRLLAGAAVAVGVAGAGLGLAPTLPAALAVSLPLGAAMITFMITGASTLQVSVSPEMRGRVMALYSVVFLGSTPIGAPLAGWIGQHAGPRAGLVLGGAVAVASGAVSFALRRRERRRSEAEPAGSPVLELPAELEGGGERSLSA